MTPSNNRVHHFSPEETNQLMSGCIKAAKQSMPIDIPVGAMILQPKITPLKPLALCHNQREMLSSPCAHAEVLAIEAAAKTLNRWRLDDCVLVVTLEPCAMCTGLILQSRIGTVIFGAYSPLDGCLGSVVNLPQQLGRNDLTILGGVEETACQDLLKQHFQTLRVGN